MNLLVKSLEIENKWELFAKYHEFGFDPLRWLPKCSNEVNNKKLNIFSELLKRNNLRIKPHYYIYFPYAEKKNIEIIRRLYKINEKIKQEDLKTKKAISIIKLNKDIIYEDDLFINEIKRISEQLKTKIEIDKISIIPSNCKEDFQFILLDHLKPQRGNKSGYTIVTSSNTQATDVTQPLESPIHMKISLTESVNLLNLLGCSIDIRLFPIYDAPNDSFLDKIRKNIDDFTIRYNYTFEDYSSLKLNSLFFGTTSTGNTHKELPNRFDLIKEETQIIITDKFGLLACLSLYIIATLDRQLLDKLDKYGIQEYKLNQLKDLAIRNLTEPKISLGKSIAKFLPNFENKFDVQSHIIATYPISKYGISSIYEISKLTNREIIIEDIPVIDKDVAKFMSKEFLISNPTASASNTNLILVTKELASTVIEELNKNKFEPKIIGKIGKARTKRINFKNKRE
jgi:selenophosphate synthase